MAKDDLFIIGGARTPMTQHVGALKDVSAIELGAIATRGALARTGVAPDAVDHVVFGNVQQSSTDAHYGARHVGLRAGLPIEVPALTVNRLCGSGIQAAVSGAQQILLGEAGVVVAGGMESMSQVPHVLRGLRSGLRLGQGKLEDWLWEGLNDPYAGCSMAITAENCAAKYGITREQADRYALRSQQRAHDAWTSGRMAEEVVAVEVKTRKGVTTIDRDDHLRPQTTLEGLAALPTVFKKDGVVTAGNASGIVDGAAALVLASGEAARARGLKPLARIVSWAAVGVEPTLMGMGPAPAIRKALERAGLTAGPARPGRDQRGVRAAIPGLREGAGPRPRAVERQRRGDRTWPSAGGQRRPAAADLGARTPPPHGALRRGVGVHRRRPGHCHGD